MLLVLVLETRNEGLSNRFLNSQAISIKKIKGPWNPLNHGPFFMKRGCEQMKAVFFWIRREYYVDRDGAKGNTGRY